MKRTRSSPEIFFAVIRALILREAALRIAGGRLSWFWLLMEPIAHLALFVALFGFILQRLIPGTDPAIFIAIGLIGYFTFQRTATQVKVGISANLALFSYRQVKVLDTLLARALVELVLMLLTSGILFAALAMIGRNVIPDNPLLVLGSLAVMWLTGLGFGLILSVVSTLSEDAGKVVDLIMRPLYFVSGVMYPILSIQQPYRDMLLLNPLVHGIEMLRHGFFPRYSSPPSIDLSYLALWALAMIFVGLLLQRRFSQRLVTL
ncbi:ABC transporter permease [Chitinilyticum piscinae]|uniref:Transport permease protein n=1 Tax=Chitinilyticum piscinae TaxID=2866724 RepID=A0A8J7K0Z1_9NEIS|nr:ABC transporter permease [Chitinilyticum piscinae]MBE9607837.1 ABC transporter permease [Chitinilyticum piscinae]